MNTKRIVSSNIKYWMCFHEMTNKELSEALEKRGFKICPSQLSKRLQGVIDFSVQEIFAIAEIWSTASSDGGLTVSKKN